MEILGGDNTYGGTAQLDHTEKNMWYAKNKSPRLGWHESGDDSYTATPTQQQGL